MILKVSRSIEAVRALLKPATLRQRTVGLVPTMGALHRGHGALIERARKECDWVVVSIFVNPLQFGPGEDLDSYPRTFDADLDTCHRLGVDVVFAPAIRELYPQEQLTRVEVSRIGDYLCGARRPGHFTGVATVVLKLFNIVQPTHAFFGEKDAQQLALIGRMVSDLNIPVKLVPVPIVRDEDGLALSSRNQYLNSTERKKAPLIHEALRAAVRSLEGGEKDVEEIRRRGLGILKSEPGLEVEYFSIVDADCMQPVSAIAGPLRVACAVRLGSTRLIDNLACCVTTQAVEKDEP